MTSQSHKSPTSVMDSLLNVVYVVNYNTIDVFFPLFYGLLDDISKNVTVPVKERCNLNKSIYDNYSVNFTQIQGKHDFEWKLEKVQSQKSLFKNNSSTLHGPIELEGTHFLEVTGNVKSIGIMYKSSFCLPTTSLHTQYHN